MFYTSLQYMKNRYDKVTRQNGLKATSLEEYEVWKDKTRKHLWEMLGLDKMEKGTSAPQILFEDEYEGCFRQKILIETLPEVFMPLYDFAGKFSFFNSTNISLYSSSFKYSFNSVLIILTSI